MSRVSHLKRIGIFLVVLTRAVGMNLDTGFDAVELEKALNQGAPNAVECAPGWVRLRGVVVPGQVAETRPKKHEAAIEESRVALARLRQRGLRICILVRWPADWRRVYLPADLRTAFENGRKLAVSYADFVDAWEIDNEPDLGFVPESAERYAAYLKATYLGLKTGGAEVHQKAAGVEKGQISSQPPLVVMGALGLPPGLWLERFAANDAFSYTDAFSYHYYGYADDFSAVYRQQERAVVELTQVSTSAIGSPKVENLKPQGFQKKLLPIFLTEIGYGMLGKEARDTKDGRLRQWRWFKSVGQQASDLRIEAPMAFYLQPYLEYGINEYGLTTDIARKLDGGSAKTAKQTGAAVAEVTAPRNLKAKEWFVGRITYNHHDFGANEAEPWMETIGKEFGGNAVTPALAQWMGLGAVSKEQAAKSRSWTVNVPAPSPVVIDFIEGEGLSFVKRYNGSFVTSKEPIAAPAGSKPITQSTDQQPRTSDQPLLVAPPRSEEFMIHVRMSNGNLYEVYPTRKATETWERYLESTGNFTMSFYGRAEVPWRFSDNMPASLVVVMYPKSLPATYEFRRAQLIRLEAASMEQRAVPMRYGTGKLVLYNFSEKPVVGRIELPEGVMMTEDGALGTTHPALTLAAGERREIEMAIRVAAGGFRRIDAPVQFVPDDLAIPPARFLTSFMPDIAGMKATVAAELLSEKPETGNLKPEGANRRLIVSRPRATEEAPMTLSVEGPRLVAFAQEGAKVEETVDGFAITVTGRPSGKPERVEVEIPWPDGLEFSKDEFLSVEYRLRP